MAAAAAAVLSPVRNTASSCSPYTLHSKLHTFRSFRISIFPYNLNSARSVRTVSSLASPNVKCASYFTNGNSSIVASQPLFSPFSPPFAISSPFLRNSSTYSVPIYVNLKSKVGKFSERTSVASKSEVIVENEQPLDNASEELEIVELPTNETSEWLLKIRHTSAHVMAMAVQKLFPKAQVTIGPWIAKGFYYDFDLDEPLTDKDLKKIKKEMDKIIGKNLPLRREEVSREEAKKRILEINEPYKLEILDSIQTEPITIYHIEK